MQHLRHPSEIQHSSDAMPQKEPAEMGIVGFCLGIKICCGTICGLGFVPKLPGTIGSMIAFLPYIIIVQGGIADQQYISAIYISLAFASFVLGIWAVPALEQRWGADPPRVIIDELLGMSLVLASPIAEHSTIWLVISFILFRFFDIIKPFPINRINARRGAFFVMLDDVMASFYTLFVLYGVWLICQLFENR